MNSLLKCIYRCYDLRAQAMIISFLMNNEIILSDPKTWANPQKICVTFNSHLQLANLASNNVMHLHYKFLKIVHIILKSIHLTKYTYHSYTP